MRKWGCSVAIPYTVTIALVTIAPFILKALFPSTAGWAIRAFAALPALLFGGLLFGYECHERILAVTALAAVVLFFAAVVFHV